MHESTEHERKRDGGRTSIVAILASPAVARRLQQRCPPTALFCTPVMVPEHVSAPSLAEKAAPLPAQYRLEILDALTDDDVDAFVDSGFAQDANFSMQLDGTWRQTQFEADAPGDADEE